MPKVEMSAELYRRFAKQHQIIKSMKQAQFVTWAHSFYGNAYNDGYGAGFDAAKSKFTQDGINVSEDVEAEVFDLDMVREILLSVKGIGEKRADQVIEKIAGYADEE